MKNSRKTNISQIVQDRILSDPMCLVEMIGWACVIISLLICLAVLKLDVQIEHIGWAFFGGGLFLAALGNYKRDKGSKCNIVSSVRNKP